MLIRLALKTQIWVNLKLRVEKGRVGWSGRGGWKRLGMDWGWLAISHPLPCCHIHGGVELSCGSVACTDVCAGRLGLQSGCWCCPLMCVAGKGRQEGCCFSQASPVQGCSGLRHVESPSAQAALCILPKLEVRLEADLMVD